MVPQFLRTSHISFFLGPHVWNLKPEKKQKSSKLFLRIFATFHRLRGLCSPPCLHCHGLSPQSEPVVVRARDPSLVEIPFSSAFTRNSRSAALCLSSSFLVMIHHRRDVPASPMLSETGTSKLRATMVILGVFANVVQNLFVIYLVIPILFKYTKWFLVRNYTLNFRNYIIP